MIRFSIRTQLFSVTAGLLVLLTVSSLMEVYHYVGQQVREQTERKIGAASHVLGSIFDQTQEQLVGRGEILIALPSLQEGLLNASGDLEVLLQEVKAVRTANLLWVTDPKGTVLASTSEYPPAESNMATHPLVKSALDGQKAISLDYFMDDWWLSLTLPVEEQDSSEVIGTVTLSLLIGQAYVSRLSEIVEAEVGLLWDERELWSDGWPHAVRDSIVFRVSKSGVSGIKESQFGEGKYLWVKKESTFGFYPDLTPLTILIGIHLDETVIHQTAQAIGWIAIIILIIGGVLLRSSIGSITQPLKQLVKDSQRVSEGDLSHRSKSSGATEVAELAGSFNKMLDNLQKSQNDLIQAKQYTDNIIHSMINSLIVTDADGIIRFTNPATEELIGFTTKELVGRSIHDLFVKGKSPINSMDSNASLSTTSIHNIETAYRTKQGKMIPMLFSSAPMRAEDGKVNGIVCAAQDMTERKNLESLKDEFIGVISHELRTPITAIDGSVSLVLDEMLGPLQPEQKEFLETALRDTKRLSRLVNTLLDLTSLEGNELVVRWQQVDLKELIKQNTLTLKSALGKRVVKQEIPTMSPIYVDRYLIGQAIGHLLNNAIQFTKENGEISIEVERTKKTVILKISDNGEGIAREDIRRLFQKFVQPGRLEEERSGGSGLGLFFCKRAVELHGGKIDVISEPGEGSLFTISLPILSSEQALTTLVNQCALRAEEQNRTFLFIRVDLQDALGKFNPRSEMKRENVLNDLEERACRQLHNRAHAIVSESMLGIVIFLEGKEEQVAVIERLRKLWGQWTKEIFAQGTDLELIFGIAEFPTDGNSFDALVDKTSRKRI